MFTITLKYSLLFVNLYRVAIKIGPYSSNLLIFLDLFMKEDGSEVRNSVGTIVIGQTGHFGNLADVECIA